MKEAKNGIAVTFEGEGLAATRRRSGRSTACSSRSAAGRIRPCPGSTGRRSRSNARGFIEVDRRARTAEPTIYAIGDVVGEPMLAHKASHEGARGGRSRLPGSASRSSRSPSRRSSSPIPELAWCGLTENEAKKQNREVDGGAVPVGAPPAARMTLDRPDGMTKLVLDPKTERVLGVGIVGPGAGELIAEGVLAVEMGANATDVRMSIHPHPTLSETIMESAEVFFGQATHVYRPRKKA